MAIFVFDGTPDENPVQLAEKDMRPDVPVAKCAAEARLAETGDEARMKDKSVEVAGDDDRSLRRITPGIVENLLELLQAQLLSPFALQVEIVNHQRLAPVIKLGD